MCYPSCRKLRNLRIKIWKNDAGKLEAHTENALTSEEFVTLERSVVESVVKRERLNVKEVDLFKAVDRWATKEVERQGLTPDGVVKRRILGEETVKAVRFPVMSQKEFASVVVDCDILTKTEIGFMMKHYGGVGLESSLPFMHSPRQPRTGLWHRVYRFFSVRAPKCLVINGNTFVVNLTPSN